MLGGTRLIWHPSFSHTGHSEKQEPVGLLRENWCPLHYDTKGERLPDFRTGRCSVPDSCTDAIRNQQLK